MKRPIPEGLLVAVEGIDGAGKTSIATLLAQWCGERGLACTISKEPTGLTHGQKLRESAQTGRLTLEQELELFILDRQDHVQRAIAPALAEGHIVILDRYYWSTAAYQGGRGADPRRIVADNEAFAPKPDLILVLDVEVATGLDRIGKRGDEPNSFENLAGLARAREIFLELAAETPSAKVIHAEKGFREVNREALLHFQRTAMEKLTQQRGLTPDAVNATLELFGGDAVS